MLMFVLLPPQVPSCRRPGFASSASSTVVVVAADVRIATVVGPIDDTQVVAVMNVVT